MRTMLAFMFGITLALGSTGCMKKIDDGKVPVTTTSEDAKKEFLEGRRLAENLQTTNSIEHFDKAIALDPTFATALLARANASFTGTEFFSYLKQALALKDHCSEGEQLFIQLTEANANGNTVKQKECVEKLSTLFPKDERVCFASGNYFFGQQDAMNAIEHYKKAVEIAPAYAPAYNSLGYAYRQAGRYDDAEAAFKKYIELIPKDPNPYDSYAELLLKMGRFDESIVNYRKALDADKYFFTSRIGIAADYVYKGKRDSAAEELNTLIAMARNDGELRQALFAQMVFNIDAGKTDLALRDVDKQYALGEKIHDAAAMSADCGSKGAILLEMGKVKDALGEYEKSVQLLVLSDLPQDLKDNARLLVHYNRAEAALGEKDLKKALEEMEALRKGAEATQNAVQLRLAHDLAGRIAFAEKKNDIAVQEFLQANLQNPYTLYRLAMSYQAQGEKAKAKEYCMKAAHFNALPSLQYAFVRTKAEKLLPSL